RDTAEIDVDFYMRFLAGENPGNPAMGPAGPRASRERSFALLTPPFLLTPVPEPCGLVLLGTGPAGLLGYGAWRRSGPRAGHPPGCSSPRGGDRRDRLARASSPASPLIRRAPRGPWSRGWP